MKRVLLLVLMLVMVMALPCVAAASSCNTAKDPFVVEFSEIDQNDDGSIVVTEFVAVFAHGGKELFALADKDKNGKLTEEEMQAWKDKYGKQQPEAVAVRHAVIDQDKDGNVVVAEFIEVFGPRSKEIFGKADKNQDGKLSKEEWEAFKDQKK
jgi:Ca2+-binding EF-hand superfamily protein